MLLRMKGASLSRASGTLIELRLTAAGCHDGEVKLRINSAALEGEIMAIITIGIDLAKNVFAASPPKSPAPPRQTPRRARLA